jgi:hypothetical protein
MSVFENPGIYVSIFSGICFIASEIMPFLPTEGNGIFHTIIKLLSNYNKQKELKKDKDTRIDDLENKINSILDKLNNINNIENT